MTYQAGLERHRDGRAVHDGRGGAFDGQALAGGHRPVAIERPAQRVDDAPQQSIAHGHVHDPARALDFISRVEMPVFAEQNDANFVFVHVERDAEQIAGKHDQFIEAHAGETGHFGDAGCDTGDRAHLPWRQFRRECFSHLADSGKRAVEIVLKALRFHVHWLLCCGLLGSALGFMDWLQLCSAWLQFVLLFRSSSTPFSSDAR